MLEYASISVKLCYVEEWRSSICYRAVCVGRRGVGRHGGKVHTTLSRLIILQDFLPVHDQCRNPWRRRPQGVVNTKASLGAPERAKKILMMGGSRFIGVYLARTLVKAGHEVSLFTRGKTPITQQLAGESNEAYAEYQLRVKHIQGDRQDFEALKSKIGEAGFEVVYDINGREAAEVEPIVDALPDLQQYIYCSSAGVYLKSDLLPHFEVDAVDPKSRHKGKLDTESLLQDKGVTWTSIRPVYIYGPLNYNPVEEWFFHRLKAGRPIPVPGSGLQITQLGHVKDLADAFVKVMDNPKAFNQVFNISGSKYVTFDGIARACAKAGGFPDPEIVHYNPKNFDFGKKKAFPLRDQHFFASIDKAKQELDWTPRFNLVDGLRDSYELDFGRGKFRKEADFSTDEMILSAGRVHATV
ncbi:chloroplast stem-loop binding protein of 41 kDa b, chloroplastic isoform X2 [Selaginella moellendorffii]|uniref:chloroplast stem-loop binding protein of 41 kDa b, chloroplastic isoform X2 n=1 Tax=Selaginella moellendorffii TaxID=88036 RepID=UPI000D1C3854|nr:chloroplast stem-loop binding protein of 41 kDa b, chloroplastic isoform X2 [Selaginella moellendorffii]|eukprot:XP_024543416.1 chloroplast stem-loop binding protein of 41 kDa b, chloroplastic isoform X2 [Selaginella moellendorffii]